MVTDPIANMLVSIKNSQAAGRASVELGYSKTKEAIVKILVERGFIKDYKVKGEVPTKTLELNLSDNPILHMRRISSPGSRQYRQAKFLPRPLRGRGLVVVSTSKGIMSGASAYRHGLGGEIICEVY